MHPVIWKGLSAVLLICLLVQQFGDRARLSIQHNAIFNQQDSSKVIDTPGDITLNAPSLTGPAPWTFEPSRDRNNHDLTIERCDSAFPDLYKQIEIARQHRNDTKIESENIKLLQGNDGGVRILIHDQQVRIIETRGIWRKDFRHRIIAVVQQVVRSVAAAEAVNEPLPDMEFTIVVDDIPNLNQDRTAALWSFTKNFANDVHNSIWLIPDFHFFGAPPENEGFRQMQTRARKHDSPLKDKIPKVVWRGVEWTNGEVRKPLLDFTANQSWADVQVMKWDDKDSIKPMDEFCDYRYVVNTEGRSWSSRLTHILSCDSIVLIHDMEWIAHYYHLFDPPTNCVWIKRDFSDLESTIAYYNEHIEEAQKIAERTKEVFRDRYITPAATACYWRRLMRTWSEVAFEPEVVDKKRGGGRLRGISFEEFM
jgi:hypothetical protein